MTCLGFLILRRRFRRLPLRLGRLRSDLRRLNIRTVVARQARATHYERETRHA
jgi:hypothetical protein